jgi:hypothetical protein
MKLVSDNEGPTQTDDYHKGFKEGLKRIARITSVTRSREELRGLLTVMRHALRLLEDVDKRTAVLKLVEE